MSGSKQKPRQRHTAAKTKRRPVRAIVIACAAIVLLGGAAVTLFAPSFLGVSGVSPPEVPVVLLDDVEAPVVRAINDARSGVVANPTSAELWGRYGQICDIHGFLEQARTCYEFAMQLAADDARWPYLLAYLYDRENEEPAASMALYRKTLAIRPNYEAALARLGDAAMRGNDFATARDAYAMAANIAPNQPALQRRLGQAQLELGAVQDAIASLERAAQLSPDDQSTHSSLARAYAAAGNTARSESEAQLATTSRPNAAELSDPMREQVVHLGVSSAVAIHRADQYLARSDFERAIPDLNLALESRPNDAGIHSRLGRAYAGLSRYDSAITHFRKVIELEPQSAVNYIRLGSVLSNLGRNDEAAELYRTAVQNDANNGAAHALLAIALVRTNKPQEALQEFEKSAAISKPTDVIEFNWGNAFMQAGNAASAAEHYVNSLTLNPEQPDTLYNLGIALEQLGRPNEAVVAYQGAVRINPQHRAATRLNAEVGP